MTDSGNKRLVAFNSLNDNDAERELLNCCAVGQWTQSLVAGRPYQTVTELKAKAGEVWWSLSEEEWLEAFKSHPKIGERKTAEPVSAKARSWSEQEQATINSSDQQGQELARLNDEYEARFGFIFIVCATGKSSTEILQLLRQRLTNDTRTEMRCAAVEQEKITQLRLDRLLIEQN